MKQCRYCGRRNADENMNCESCGALLPDKGDNRPASVTATMPGGYYQPGEKPKTAPSASAASMPAGSYANPGVVSQNNGPRPVRNMPYPGGYGEGSGSQAFNQPQRPARYASGGLIAWSVLTLLLCTIPGIVALVYAAGINGSYSAEEQQKKINNARTWCIVGTVLGVLSIGLQFLAALSNR